MWERPKCRDFRSPNRMSGHQSPTFCSPLANFATIQNPQHWRMRILVVGSGGREHALAWKLRQSTAVDQIFCAPGNAGTAKIGENVAINAGDLSALARFAKQNRIGLTVVGPDDP